MFLYVPAFAIFCKTLQRLICINIYNNYMYIYGKAMQQKNIFKFLFFLKNPLTKLLRSIIYYYKFLAQSDYRQAWHDLFCLFEGKCPKRQPDVICAFFQTMRMTEARRKTISKNQREKKELK
jgi:hypothetical protein